VDAAGRAYVAVYVAVFVVSAIALVGVIWWRNGAGMPLASVLAGSVIAVLWSRHSGRHYVDRMFQHYRAELSDCLAQIERQP
jgi:hypothetical protein